jgi:hypothetical protein
VVLVAVSGANIKKRSEEPEARSEEKYRVQEKK